MVEAEEAAVVVDQVADLEVAVEVAAEPALALAQALASADCKSSKSSISYSEKKSHGLSCTPS